MMRRRGLADADAGLEPGGIGGDQRAAVDAASLRQSKQGRKDRRTRMQNDPAHMRVVIVQHMSHLTIGDRGFELTELDRCPSTCAWSPPPALFNTDSSISMFLCWLPASAQPIQSSTPRRA